MERVCILLSTFNGEKYLKEQIDSILSQKGVSVVLFIRDDGSKDKTVSIIKEYSKKHQNIVLLEQCFGVNYGIAKSFAFLLHYAYQIEPGINYYFFADQDDCWLPNKCVMAVEKLSAFRDKMALYFSKKKLVDENLQPLEKLDKVRFTGAFFDFFDRCNAFGCTMCLTKPLALLLANDVFYERPFLHDNYTYRLCIAIGCPIVYDDAETLLYRQHGNNVTGAVKQNVFRGLKKLFIQNRVHVVREMSEYLLDKHNNIIEKSNIEILRLFVESYHSFKAKIKVVNFYFHQGNRNFKEKVLFAFLIFVNYY